MANLYATISYDHHAGHASRTAHKWLMVTAETWSGIVRIRLTKDGTCRVSLTDKHRNPVKTLWEGNIDEEAKRER